ncbi:MAG: substrate-binding periplasmic protein [Elsteraceae bacterium]
MGVEFLGLLRATAFAATMGLSGVAQAEQPLRFTTEEYPPFNFTDSKGTLVGIATDILLEMTKRAGVKATFEIMPWIRAYNEALNKPDTCAYSTTVTEARQELFQWVTPLLHNDWVIFARVDNAQKVSSLADLKGRRIGVYHGGAIETFLQRETGFILESAIRDDLNPVKLSKGEIDYWATGGALGQALTLKAQIKTIRPAFSFRDVELGLACNKVVPETKIAALRAALAAMTKEGVIEKIQTRYWLEF